MCRAVAPHASLMQASCKLAAAAAQVRLYDESYEAATSTSFAHDLDALAGGPGHGSATRGPMQRHKTLIDVVLQRKRKGGKVQLLDEDLENVPFRCAPAGAHACVYARDALASQ